MTNTIGEYNFAGQYQQSPALLGGGLVKAKWFKRYRENELPEPFERIVQSWDTANKATELSDFSVCTTWGVKGKNLFLLGLFRRRLEYPALKRAMREQQNLFNASVVLIEDKASGTQLIQDLIEHGCHGVTRYQPTGDKTMRMHAQTAMIENGFVHIPETAAWLAEYLHELTVFPKAKHDDQADSTAQFLDWFKTPMPSWGIFEYTRQLAEAAEQGRKPPPVKNRMRPRLHRVARRAGESEVNRACPRASYPAGYRVTRRLSSPYGTESSIRCSYNRRMPTATPLAGSATHCSRHLWPHTPAGRCARAIMTRVTCSPSKGR